MKLGRIFSRHAFVRFWALHGYLGIASSLLLYLMFLCGSITLFRQELELWEEPLLQEAPSERRSFGESLEMVLANVGPIEREFWIHPARGGSSLELVYQPRGSVEWRSSFVVARTGEVQPSRERLSKFIYELHFLWHEATGTTLYYLAGLLAFAMLVAILSGVLLALKDLPEHVWRFRPFRGSRLLWSDLHKVLGLMGLPVQLMYAYTATLLVFAPLLIRAFVGPVFAGDVGRAHELAFGFAERAHIPGAATVVLPADELVSRAQRELPGIQIEAMEMSDHATVGGRFAAWGFLPGVPQQRAHVVLQESDGRVLHKTSLHPDASTGLRTWVLGLHVGRFGGPWLRGALLLLGICGCATLISGNLIWIVRRKARGDRAFVPAFERLTLGIGGGSVVALASLFFTSRVVPLDVLRRSAWEEAAFWGGFAASLGCAFCVRSAGGAAWWPFVGSGALFLSTPVFAARLSSAGVFGAGPHVAAVVGVDVALALSGTLLLAVGFWLRKRLAADSRPAARSAHAFNSEATHV